MQKNVLEYLEQTVLRVPDKTAYSDGTDSLSFREVYDRARSVGSFLAREGYVRKPVVVFMKKHPNAITAFYGVLYSGCYYVPLDEEMPQYRIQLIFDTLAPEAVICDGETIRLAEKYGLGGRHYLFEELAAAPVDEERLARIRDRQISTDPIYVVFTSGSTGVPKGVVACHRSVIDYIENLSEILRVSENTVFGNQAPLYFDACLKELYPTLKFGASAYLIPKGLFMFPIKLVEFLREYRINTVCWVASALSLISGFRVLDKLVPDTLHTIAFGSEVFPVKQYEQWKKALPDTRFINLYGPTETTGMCCYFEVNREFGPDEAIPIGRPFPNREILLLTADGKEAPAGEPGEICIRGNALTMGYYNAPDKTAEVFVQNPLNPHYPELIYRTGDLGKYNERGELVFVSRKDYQIKHMGHRIELAEIELSVSRMEHVELSCCVYDREREKIVLYYVGSASPKEVTAYLKECLPRYMIPNTIEALEQMPLTANGKIDRVLLKNRAGSKQKG